MKKSLFFKLMIGFLSVSTFLSSCKFLNPSVMLRTKRGFVYDLPPAIPDQEYRISSNDILDFRIYTNDGFKLIDLTNESPTLANTQAFQQAYLVDNEGNTKLPLLGKINLKGLTIKETEKILEDQYSQFYNKPFAIVRVTNKRVIIFPGSEGAARVVNLENNNTTLLEALAFAGGIAQTGKSYRIKIVRQTASKPEVYLINLSEISGLEQGKIILQANDMIYVEPRLRIATDLVSELSPILSIISSLGVLYVLISRF